MTDASLERAGEDATPPAFLQAPAVLRRRSMVLITGGSGFLGSSLADRLAAAGERVLIYDNLSRPNDLQNLEWLQRRHGHRIETAIADVRDADALRDTVRHASAIFHLAAEVAETASLEDPLADLEVNARGTLNVLEAARRRPDPPCFVMASTNKVYGEPFETSQLVAGERRYRPADGLPRAIDEGCPPGLHSPYGCSKGAADQSVLDYARMFRLRTVVFRVSCLYGPRQYGTEDEGWVAHLLLRALRGQPITIFGDGNQVRDLLYVDDAVDAYLLARARIASVFGHAFNLGGGPRNTASLLELLARFGELGIAPPPVRFAAGRRGDQLYAVSDTSKFERLTGWHARIGVTEGLRRLQRWLVSRLIEQPRLEAGPAIEKVPA